jgi:superfamily II DNA/RNA helicase
MKQFSHHSPQHNNTQPVAEHAPDKDHLPIDKKKESIIENIVHNPSVLVSGETGSGKTTQLPLWLLEKFPNKKICATSPRVLPARSVSNFVSGKIGENVGGTVGLVTRQDRRVSKDTRLTFMTDGVLLSMLHNDITLPEFDIVMIDEAHERTINIDLLLGLLKEVQVYRENEGLPELKIIIASATMEEEKFANYFDGAPVERVEGRMYPVTTHYHEPLVVDGKEEPFTDAAVRVLVEEIISPNKEGDVLVFMPGEGEIKAVVDILKKRLNDESNIILPLHGSMNPEEQNKIFEVSDKRKIIVATNIAETSVTIDGIKHVIDSGVAKENRYDPITGISALKIVKISQANMKQREGRAGRTAPGACYRLMSKEEFDRREPFQRAEILRANLSDVILRMLDMGIKDIEHFDFIEKPSLTHIRSALQELHTLGAIDKEGDITDVGVEMVGYQMRPDVARMLVEGRHEGVLGTMVTITAFLAAAKSPFIFPGEAKTPEEAISNRERLRNQEKLRVPGSDIKTFLNIWNTWLEHRKAASFCYDYFLNSKVLQEINETRLQVLKALGDVEISSEDTDIGSLDVEKVIKCILAAIPDSLFYTDYERKYYNPIQESAGKKGAQIFPGSSCFMQGEELMLAFNVSPTEKINKKGEKTSNLWARICHTIPLKDAKRLLGDICEEKKVPSRFLYAASSAVTYDVFVHGKKIGRYSKQIFSPEDILYTGASDIMFNNRTEYERYEQLYVRSGGSLPKVILRDFYDDIAKALDIKDEQGVIAHKEDFIFRCNLHVDEEEIEAIERDSPSNIKVQGFTFPIFYHIDPLYNGFVAEIEVPHTDALDALLSLDTLSFPRMKQVTIRYNGFKYRSLELLRRAIEKKKIEQQALQERLRTEFMSRARSSAGNQKERYGKGEESRPVGEQVLRAVKNIQRVVEEKKRISPEEERARWVKEFGVLPGVLELIKNTIKGKHERELSEKDKTKMLERLQEIRREVRRLEEVLQAKEINHESVRGRISTVMQSIGTLLKGAGSSSTLTILLSSIENISSSLTVAARTNGEDTKALQEKIREKAVVMAFNGERELNLDQATDIIIELI